MSSEKWRIIIESVGFTAVIVSLLLVALELNQTQKAMQAAAVDASNERTDDNSQLAIEFGIVEIREKILNGTELTNNERARHTIFYETLLRHYETTHYQYSLGLVDEEIWQAKFRGLRSFTRNPSFDYAFPEWRNGIDPGQFRTSFVELVNGLIR